MSGREALVSAYSATGDDGPEIEADLGGGDPAILDVYASPGEDSPPLEGDYVAAINVDPHGEQLATVAYADETERIAEPGEKRIYARNAAGEITAELHMKGDGSVTIQAAAGAVVEIADDGAITLSGSSVSLQVGEAIGSFLQTLHLGVTTWAPVPNDGGAALKASLAPWLTQTPPGP